MVRGNHCASLEEWLPPMGRSGDSGFSAAAYRCLASKESHPRRRKGDDRASDDQGFGGGAQWLGAFSGVGSGGEHPVGGRYPHGEVRLVFPVEPEGFFFSEPLVPMRATGYQQTYGVAA
jgi:hypothetical protein